MLGAINKASLHYEYCGEKSAKILFHSFHLLLEMKKIPTSTCVLATRIFAVNVSVGQIFLFFMIRSAMMAALLES